MARLIFIITKHVNKMTMTFYLIHALVGIATSFFIAMLKLSQHLVKFREIWSKPPYGLNVNSDLCIRHISRAT